MTATQPHWRDRAIERSEIVSDALEVAKAWGAHAAEWILFGCLIANLLELFPFFPDRLATAVMIVQSITLDVAGFGLTSMGSSARRRGDSRAANTASVMGWTLIALMVVTVTLVSLPKLIPTTADIVHWAEIALILVRIIVTVFYSHIVHALRQSTTEYTNEVSSLREQVSSLEQAVSTFQHHLSTGQRTVDTLRVQLREKEQEVDTLRLQVDSGQRALENLHGHLRNKAAELTGGQSAVESLKRQLAMRVQDVDSLSRHLREKQEQVSRLQGQVSSLEQEVSRLRVQVDREKRGQVDSGQGQSVDSGHTGGQRKVDSGQVISLDAKKRGRDAADHELGEKIKKMLHEEPGLSDRAIAGKLSCSPTTVGRWRRLIERETREYVSG
jgi:peptidoglycan hydrolase CwlO-like protein